MKRILSRIWLLVVMEVLAPFGGAGRAVAWTRDLPEGWLHSTASLQRILHQEDLSNRDSWPAGLWLATGQTNLYGLAELPQHYVALGGSRGGERPVGFSLGWQVTGADLVHSRLLEGSLDFGRAWKWGFDGSIRRLSIADQEKTSQVYTGAHVRRQIVLGHGLWSQVEGFFQVWSQTEMGVSSSYQKIFRLEIGYSRQSFELLVERDRQGNPSLDMEAGVGLGPDIGLVFRACPATGTLGPGVCFAKSKMMVLTSHLVHPALGVTHRVMIVFGNWQGCFL